MKTKCNMSLLAALLGITVSSQANNITGLYNTGVDSAGTPLPDVTIGDPPYALTFVPPGSTTAIVVRTVASHESGDPVGGGGWIAPDASSAWIGPDNNYFADGPAGQYIYTTTFDVTGDPSQASILGWWSADDVEVAISLNGGAMGNMGNTTWNAWSPFTISSGSKDGVNSLTFLVDNGGGPTGLRVEFGAAEPAIGTYDSSGSGSSGSTVPETLSTGFAGVLLLLSFEISTLRIFRKSRTS